jgi:hypothetical protein
MLAEDAPQAQPATMTIQDVLNPHLPRVRMDEPAGAARKRLRRALRYRYLPVLDASERYAGMVNTELLRTAPEAEPVSALLESVPPVTLEDHPFEVARRLQTGPWTLYPVVDASGKYMGCIERDTLYGYFARLLSTHEHGAVLTVLLAPCDYTLSEIVRLIESHGAKILSISTELAPATASPAEGEASGSNAPLWHRVTIKLNVLEAEPIARTLERFGYSVFLSAESTLQDDELQRRLQELLRYLEV